MNLSLRSPRGSSHYYRSFTHPIAVRFPTTPHHRMTHPTAPGSESTVRRLTRETLARLERAGKVSVAKLSSVLVDFSIVGIPIALKPGWAGSWIDIPGPLMVNLLGLWAVLIVGRWGATQVKRGKHMAEWNVYWSKRADLLAGNISEARQLLFIGRRKGGREISSKQIVAGLLQQIVDVAQQLTGAPDSIIIQACMLRPVSRDGMVVGLRAETYNKLTSSHRHSLIPLDCAGAATEAYRTNRIAVVHDTLVEPYRQQFEGRPYRCVAAFPVEIGDGTGKLRVVVTIDASAPYILTDAVVERLGIKDAVSPFLSLIGLVEMGAKRLKGEPAYATDERESDE